MVQMVFVKYPNESDAHACLSVDDGVFIARGEAICNSRVKFLHNPSPSVYNFPGYKTAGVGRPIFIG